MKIERIHSRAVGKFFDYAPEQHGLAAQATENGEFRSLSDLLDMNADEATPYENIFGETLKIIATSPVGRAMLKEAVSLDWSAGFEEFTGPMAGEEFCIDVQARQIIFDNNALAPEALADSPFYSNALILSMARALRQVWQEKRHGGFDQSFGPEAIMMLDRARMADCHVMAVMVAWELRSEGHNSLWRHLIGSEEGDMAMAFSRCLERTPGAMFSGKALAAAFHQWYLCEERVNASDHAALEYLDGVMAERTEQNPFGCKAVGRLDVEVLSCLPDKTAYLLGEGENILRDPRYAGLCDPINQTHLYHIMRDLETVMAGGVPFRDAALAAKIFPAED